MTVETSAAASEPISVRQGHDSPSEGTDKPRPPGAADLGLDHQQPAHVMLLVMALGFGREVLHWWHDEGLAGGAQ